jgi:hypothetical protein
MTCGFLESVIHYTKRIKQAGCRQVNERQPEINENKIKHAISGMAIDWGLKRYAHLYVKYSADNLTL